MADVAIKVDHVSKAFRLPHEKQTSIKGLFVNMFRGRRTYERQQVLKDVSFEIKKGEFFGIVGRNGGGKSTLLKLLAGIYQPDQGHVGVYGKLTPFIELGVGFNPELTGRENVYLNGALLGFNRKEMDGMYAEIVDFAEMGKFMDQKLKNYSSGMQVRLAFSIAIRAQSDILLIDEVLAVGDAAFQQKCFEYFELLKQGDKTIIFVSHDMAAVKRFCTRALLIEGGEVKQIGSPEDVAGQYLLDNISADQTQLDKRKNMGEEVGALKVNLLSAKKLKHHDTLEFQIAYKLKKDLAVDLGYSIASNGFSVAEQNTKAEILPSTAGKTHTITCRVPLENFNPGSYTLDAAIFTKKGFRLIGYEIGAAHFVVEGIDKLRGGPMRANGEWYAKEK